MTDINKIDFRSNGMGQGETGEVVGDHSSSLADELMKLTDDFTEYSDISAFLCNALVTTLKEQDWLNQEIISGARICSGWLQQMTDELKDDIHHVHQRFVAEQSKVHNT